MSALNDRLRLLDELNPDRNPYLVIHSDILGLRNLEDPVNVTAEAFLEYARTRNVTLFFPTFSPEVCSTGFYSTLETPCSTGAINTEMLKRGAVRNNHPIDSYAAIGKEKEKVFTFTDKNLHEENSACAFFEKVNARFILWGARPSKITMIHFYEFAAKPSYRYYKVFRGNLRDHLGNHKSYQFNFFVKKRFLTESSDFDHIDSDLLTNVPYVEKKVPEGNFYSIDEKSLAPFIRKKLKEDEYYLLNDREQVRVRAKQTRLSFFSSENLDLVKRLFDEAADRFKIKDYFCWQLPFDSYRQDLLSSLPQLFENGVNVGIFTERIEKVLGADATNLLQEKDIQKFANERVDEYLKYVALYLEKMGGTAFVCDFIPFENQAYYFLNDSILTRAVQYANEHLRVQISKLKGARVFRLSDIVHRVGQNNSLDKKLFFMGRIPFSLELSKQMVFEIIGTLLESQGKTARGIILDLDNTLWGGIVGEDGKDHLALGPDYPGSAFVYFQKRLAELRSRGVFLALCSKNTEEIALDAIETHPYMVLRKKDFSSIRINWRHKSENISEIAAELSLGLKNLLFIDDSPLERDEIRKLLPDIIVPEFPTDICLLADSLIQNPFLYCSTFLKEDLKRIENFETSKQIGSLREDSGNLEEFYRSLHMRCRLIDMNDLNRDRILSLISKTNQFNTTTKRYTAREINQLMEKGARVFGIRYSDHLMSEPEYIGVVIGIPTDASFVIDLFLMSCRYLNRTIETKVLSELSHISKEYGCQTLMGLLIPTERNVIIKDLYLNHQFSPQPENKFVYSLTNGEIPAPQWFAGPASL
jgi:FkbH-like protein